MKKTTLLLLATVLISFCGCKKDDPTYTEGETEILWEGEKTSSDGAKILETVSVFGNVAQDILDAFTTRSATIKTGDTQQKVALVAMSALDEKVFGMLADGGIAIIVNPDLAKVNEWLSSNEANISLAVQDEAPGILAISANGSTFAMDTEIDAESVLSDHMNELVGWVNSMSVPVLLSPENSAGSQIDIQSLTDRHQSSYRYTFANSRIQISDDESIDGKVYVTYITDTYPVYSFASQSGHGDYYVMHSTISVASNEFYKKYNVYHFPLYWRIIGGYLKYLDVAITPLDGNGNTSDKIEFAATPRPLTVVNQTSYTNGMEWSITGSVSGGISSLKGAYVEACINGGVKFSNSETRVIQDVDINNTTNDTRVVRYRYQVNNLPHYQLNISFSDPPAVAYATASFDIYWVWKCASTEDFDSTTVFKFKTEVTPVYEAKFFRSTGADLVEKAQNLGTMSHIETLPMPNRTPTAEVKITNTRSGEFMSDITIKGEKSGKVIFSDSGSSYGYNNSKNMRMILNRIDNSCEESYIVSLKSGKDAESALTYTTRIKLHVGDAVSLNTSYDFK